MEKSRIRKAAKITVALLIILPLCTFALSNLFLMSPFGRGFIADKISSVCKLETTIKGSSWSPWNGISCYGIKMLQPDLLRKEIKQPLLKIESVRISPSWLALFKRKLEIEGIDIRKPELILPIELLTQLPIQEVVDKPKLAANPSKDSSIPAFEKTEADQLTQKNLEKSPSALSLPTPPSIAVIPQVKVAKEAAIPAPNIGTNPPAVAPLQPHTLTPNFWISISNAKFAVVSTFSKSPLYEVDQIDTNLPLGGAPAKSEIYLKQIKSLGEILSKNLVIPINWTGQVFETEIFDSEYSGITIKTKASIGLNRNLPFRINALMPEQADKKIEFVENTGIDIGTLAAQGVFQGYLRHPQSWQGQWIGQARSVAIRHQNTKAQFDHGETLIILQNGMIRCLDARLIGETLSVIGNATILQDGRTAAIARVIGSPEDLNSISRFTNPRGDASKLLQLSSPQRAALDLQIFGSLRKLFYKPDPFSDPIPLN